MLKNKYIKVLMSSFLVLMALWVATPKVYIHELFNHDHSEISIGTETKVKSESTDDCDFEKYNKPVYFSIFKFISSFLPLKPQNTNKSSAKAISLSIISQAVSLLRGPPVSE